ncbi:MAG: SemiSWEET family transporter [bacterium]|nr:SemiSWEET family transporter [bacterium]
MPDAGIRHVHKRKRPCTSCEEYPHKSKKIMDYLIYIVCIATPIVAAPQAWKIWSQQNASGISLITYIGFVIGNIIWIVYGIMHKEKPIILLYVFLLIINILIAVGRILYG